MIKWMYIALATTALVSCQGEVPCLGFRECPLDVSLSVSDAPCCCDGERVDEDLLSSVGEPWATSSKDVDTGDCTLESVVCSSNLGLEKGILCD